MKKLMFVSCVLVALLVPLSLSAIPYGVGAYGTCDYEEGGCVISIMTSGSVDLELAPTPDGVITIAKDDITVTTNSNAGFELRIESNSATDNELIKDEYEISATTATTADPAPLGLNEWGYRVDGIFGFGSGPTAAVSNQPTSDVLFAGIPLLGDPDIIKTTAEAAPNGDVTSVWYGVRVDMTQPAGIYTQTVMYTAVAL